MLSPFWSDGCSVVGQVWKFFTGHPEPWEGACVEHDYRYWAGGSDQDRFEADLCLLIAIATHPKGGIWWALLYFVGVRLGGSWIWPTPYGWGYGRRWWLQ